MPVSTSLEPVTDNTLPSPIGVSMPEEKIKAITITTKKEPTDIPNFFSLDLSEAIFFKEKTSVDKVTSAKTIIANHIIYETKP